MGVAFIKESDTEKIVTNINELSKDKYYHIGIIVDGKVVMLDNKEVKEIQFESRMQFFDENKNLKNIQVSLSLDECPDWVGNINKDDMILTLCSLDKVIAHDKNNMLIVFNVV